MIKNSLKKIFIKITRLFGYEIVDQNNFVSPTLGKELNENLSIFNKKSLVLPLGQINITRKVNSLLIIFRTNSNIEIWDQNKKRIFEEQKIVYTEKSLKSLLKCIHETNTILPSLDIKLIVLDDNSSLDNLNKIKKIVEDGNIKYELFNHDLKKYKNLIKEQKTQETFSNLSSLLTCFDLGREKSEDLVFFC